MGRRVWDFGRVDLAGLRYGPGGRCRVPLEVGDERGTRFV